MTSVMTSKEWRSSCSISGRTLFRSKKLIKKRSKRGIHSRLAFALKSVDYYFFLVNDYNSNTKKKNDIPDITHRSRIRCHEDLDRSFGIIKESLEFLFVSWLLRLAGDWNLNSFDVNQTRYRVWHNSRSISSPEQSSSSSFGSVASIFFSLFNRRNSRAFMDTKVPLELGRNKIFVNGNSSCL